MTRVGLTATAHYLPERWMSAAEVGAASGIPEDVVVAKFGLRGKHIAADDEHVSDLAVAAGARLLEEHGIEPASHATVDARRHFLDVADPAQMKGGLDEVSLPNFVAAAEGALARSGATVADVSYLCGIHMKRSMHEAIVDALGLPLERAAYLDDTGHMSGVDPLLALDRAVRAGDVADGDLVLLLAAGTGYTWAASTVRWGPA